MRPILFSLKDIAEVGAAVDSAFGDRSLAHDASILSHDLCPALEHTGHEPGEREQSTEGQGLRQKRRSEELGNRCILERLVQHIGCDDEQHDPQAES